MYIGQKWHCVNPQCGAELIITESSRVVNVDKPRCGCGAAMKRAYEKPTLRKVVTSTGEARTAAAGNESTWG